MSNPYAHDYDDDFDDLDSLPSRRGKKKHVLNGEICPECGIAHDVHTDEEIPEEVLDKVADLLDDLPPGVVHSEVIVARAGAPSRSRILREFADFARGITENRRMGPLIQAVAEVVDDMSGGLVSRRWELHESELELYVSHLLLKTVNTMSEMLTNNSVDDDDPERIRTILDTLVQTSIDRVHGARETYELRCVENDRPPDKQLIETGVISEENKSQFSEQAMSSASQALKRWLQDNQSKHGSI